MLADTLERDPPKLFRRVVLQIMELLVGAIALQKLGVGSLLDDMAMVHDDDEIGIDDGGEAVCDGDDGAVFHQRVKCLLDKMFRGGVERGCRFVENENRRILEQGAGDGETLFLAA